jgi:hypothetical protein
MFNSYTFLYLTSYVHLSAWRGADLRSRLTEGDKRYIRVLETDEPYLSVLRYITRGKCRERRRDWGRCVPLLTSACLVAAPSSFNLTQSGVPRGPFLVTLQEGKLLTHSHTSTTLTTRYLCLQLANQTYRLATYLWVRDPGV